MKTGVKHTSTLWDKAVEKFMGIFRTKDPFHVEVHSHHGCDEIKRKELAIQLREAAVSNCSFPQDSSPGKPFHVEVHSHRGCGNCHWWCPEDHDCSCPADCDHLSDWRPREDNT